MEAEEIKTFIETVNEETKKSLNVTIRDYILKAAKEGKGCVELMLNDNSKRHLDEVIKELESEGFIISNKDKYTCFSWGEIERDNPLREVY